MSAAIDVLSWICLLAGSAFVVIGALGLVRMPDLYTRMHATSVIDTLGAGLLILGMILQAGFTLISFKLLVALGLLFFIGPVTAYALAQAALHENVKPKLTDDRRDRLSKSAHAHQDQVGGEGESAATPSKEATL